MSIKTIFTLTLYVVLCSHVSICYADVNQVKDTEEVHNQELLDEELLDEELLNDDDIFWDDNIDTAPSSETDAQSQKNSPSIAIVLLKEGITDISHTLALSDNTRSDNSQSGNNIYLNRTKFRWFTEGAITQNWFVKFDNKFTYYATQDAQANPHSEFRYKLQNATLQYSRNKCALTIGRQALIWGEVDGTFATDVVTPFDLTEQLLTDYSAIRLAQDLAVLDCYFDSFQIQTFLNTEARMDQVQLDNERFESRTGSEIGSRFKYTGKKIDISFMLAELYANMAVPLVRSPPGSTMTEDMNIQQPPNAILNSNKHYFFGLSTSVAVGRLLINTDLGFKDKQQLPFLVEGSSLKTWDLAIGLEYTNRYNHNFTAGLWQTTYTGDATIFNRLNMTLENVDTNEFNVLRYSVRWSKAYWNDNLNMSALLYGSDTPNINTIAINGVYAINDQWSISTALTHSESNQSDNNAAGFNQAPDTYITGEIRVQF